MRVAIIGGSGRMGRWFANFLLKDGKEVVITGRNENKLLEAKRQLGVEVAVKAEAVVGADVIILSVPISNFESVVQEIQPYIRPNQIVVDITSIKVLPLETMHKHLKTALIMGTHPMFGPAARTMANQNIILTPTDEKERTLARKLRQYLEIKGARVTLMSPHEHDEMMTIILGLAHFIAIVSADTLFSLGKLKQSETISGPTYKLLLTLVESVISQDPALYASLQMSLPNMTAVEELFQRNARRWAELVESKDRQNFIHSMKVLREGLKIDIS